MISIAIVEDDKENQKQLQDFLLSYQKEIKEEIKITLFSNGLNFIEEYKPIYDIVFMDINMPLMDGMKASRLLRERDENVDLIFTTVLKEYSLFGYDVNASAFLIKPFDENMLKDKLDKILSRRRRDREEGFIFNDENIHVRVPNCDITYIESLDHYCIFHTAKDKEFRKLISLKDVEKKLASSGFLRCNNSYLVNPIYIDEYQKDSLKVHGKEIPVSRTRRKVFFESLAKVFGERYQ